MKISRNCVVGLTWTLKDSLGELLDQLDAPAEFLVGGNDLLPAIESALQEHGRGDVLQLNLEPEHAFGNYDEQLVFLLPRSALQDGAEPGLLIEAGSLPAGSITGLASDHLLTITEVYPEHIVLDGNHPLAGISLRLQLKVTDVRAASQAEARAGSAGPGFFRLQLGKPADHKLHYRPGN